MSLSDDQPPQPATDHRPAPQPRAPALADCDTFVTNVRAACASPGTQQALRRALAKPVDEVPARTHAALLRGGLIPDSARGAKKRAYYAVAALIAARPRAERQTDTDTAAPADLGEPAHEQPAQPSATTEPVPTPGAPPTAWGPAWGPAWPRP